MKEKILITGASGLLAKKLGKKLLDTNYNINYLTTSKKDISNKKFYWNYSKNHIDKEALQNVDHIIHLAGLNISKNWSSKNKELMFDSRVQTSKLILNKCKELNIKPKTFISASAMGYYGFYQSGIKTEDSKPGTDWMANLCVAWERAADKFEQIGSRVIKLRLSVLIDSNSDILIKTCLSFKLGFGVVFGNGNQPFPWIHIDDVTKFIIYIIEKKNINGVFNLSSPQHISHYEFIKTLQKIKYIKSKIIYAPRFLMNLLFYRKKVLLFNEVILCTQKVKKTQFKWDYPEIGAALKQLLN